MGEAKEQTDAKEQTEAEQRESKEQREAKEQRVCIKFCCKLDKSASETYRMIKEAFGEEALSRARIFEWYKRFKKGRDFIGDNHRSGRPLSSHHKIVQVNKVILEDTRQSIRDVCNIVHISYGACQRIIAEELGLRRISGKFVPRLLSNEQREHRVQVCKTLQQVDKDDSDFLSKVITGGERWVYYGYDPRKHFKTPIKPKSKKSGKPPKKGKSVMIVFFDSQGIVHHEFVPPGETITESFYCDVLRHLCESVKHKRPTLWSSKDWLLHHDIAPAHTSLLVREFLENTSIITVPHPPYSSDLAPSDFFLFPKMKYRMKPFYESIDDFQAELPKILKTITEEDYEGCFQSWKGRWSRCIDAKGDYFEGNSGNF